MASPSSASNSPHPIQEDDYFPLTYLLSLSLSQLQIAFTTKKDYGIEEREAQWATAQRTLHGLQNPQTATLFSDKSSYRELSEIAEQAKRRAEIARFVLSTLFFPLDRSTHNHHGNAESPQ